MQNFYDYLVPFGVNAITNRHPFINHCAYLKLGSNCKTDYDFGLPKEFFSVGEKTLHQLNYATGDERLPTIRATTTSAGLVIYIPTVFARNLTELPYTVTGDTVVDQNAPWRLKPDPDWIYQIHKKFPFIFRLDKSDMDYLYRATMAYDEEQRLMREQKRQEDIQKLQELEVPVTEDNIKLLNSVLCFDVYYNYTDDGEVYRRWNNLYNRFNELLTPYPKLKQLFLDRFKQ